MNGEGDDNSNKSGVTIHKFEFEPKFLNLYNSVGVFDGDAFADVTQRL